MAKRLLKMVKAEKQEVTSEELKIMIELFGKELNEMIQEKLGSLVDTTGIFDSLDKLKNSIADLNNNLKIEKENTEVKNNG